MESKLQNKQKQKSVFIKINFENIVPSKPGCTTNCTFKAPTVETLKR